MKGLLYKILLSIKLITMTTIPTAITAVLEAVMGMATITVEKIPRSRVF